MSRAHAAIEVDKWPAQHEVCLNPYKIIGKTATTRLAADAYIRNDRVEPAI